MWYNQSQVKTVADSLENNNKAYVQYNNLVNDISGKSESPLLFGALYDSWWKVFPYFINVQKCRQLHVCMLKSIVFQLNTAQFFNFQTK